MCAAASRIYVPRSRHDEFVEALAAAVGELRLGAGMDPQAQVNPLVSRRQQASVVGHLGKARAQGARVVTGGGAPELPGFFVEPTGLDRVDHGMAAAREEIFGPVLAVLAYERIEDAVAMVNDSHYGLAASLWTNDLTQAMRLLPQIEAGTVWVNSHVPLDPNLPFGVSPS